MFQYKKLRSVSMGLVNCCYAIYGVCSCVVYFATSEANPFIYFIIVDFA